MQRPGHRQRHMVRLGFRLATVSAYREICKLYENSAPLLNEGRLRSHG